MKRFLLYLHTGRPEAIEALDAFLHDMRDRDIRPVFLDEQIRELENGSVPAGPAMAQRLRAGHAHIVTSIQHDGAASPLDLAIVLGGDGTILRALDSVREADIPVHGVNLGHVGFLAESEAPELGETIDRLLDGDWILEERSCLEIVVRDQNFQIVDSGWAMNDASLEKADRQKMVHVTIEIDSRPVSSFGCDGVLLSSSTGSTAYAFSAGGPVVWPEVEALVLVPLAAHALFARPLVLGRSSTAAVELSMEDKGSAAVLTLDGRRVIPLDGGMRVESRIAAKPVRFARLSDTPFADRLVEKFQLPVVGWRGQAAARRRAAVTGEVPAQDDRASAERER